MNLKSDSNENPKSTYSASTATMLGMYQKFCSLLATVNLHYTYSITSTLEKHLGTDL